MNWDLLSLLKQLVKDRRLAVSHEELDDTFNALSPASPKQKAIYSIIGRIIQTSGQAEIGMSVGKYINPNSFHGLGYLFMTADNLVMACERICEFPLFFQSLVSISTHMNSDNLEFRVENNANCTMTNAIINEATLGIIYQYTNWLSREVISDCDIELVHGPISGNATYEKYFNAEPKFKAQCNQLRFPLKTALSPLLTSEPEYHCALYSKLKQKHEQMSQSFLARTQNAIRNGLKLGRISRQRVASELSLSEKTLERRLNQYNYSYRELIDTIRLELAQKYLSQTQYSIDDIARNLGYCDRSTFSKAYKKWTGVTPGFHRQKQLRE
ncbi:AraC family transcriptional regulator [Pleionea sediminis]|uniref:AraC family transcriptional regulator n=1 Tax=Pleionea sediminis TaxID=2569479 RepID=UPI0011855ECB|nr:AraC family transcriptional regulator [Pleionea sediminis]